MARIGVAKAEFWPSVSLSGSIRPSNIRGGANPTSWSLGPQINLPIFTGGANRANLKAAESRAVQAHIRWQAAVLDAVEEVENGLSAWRRGGANVAAQRKLVGTAQETVTPAAVEALYGIRVVALIDPRGRAAALVRDRERAE